MAACWRSFLPFFPKRKRHVFIFHLWKTINKSFGFKNRTFIFKNKTFGFKNKSFILSFIQDENQLSIIGQYITILRIRTKSLSLQKIQDVDMEIKSAEFVISNSKIEKCPNTNIPEYAFIGRSNVGKSSLINMLACNKKLAKTSATPGKTLLINHFIINGEWYLVDLPGYGYAKRGKREQEELRKIISDRKSVV